MRIFASDEDTDELTAVGESLFEIGALFFISKFFFISEGDEQRIERLERQLKEARESPGAYKSFTFTHPLHYNSVIDFIFVARKYVKKFFEIIAFKKLNQKFCLNFVKLFEIIVI